MNFKVKTVRRILLTAVMLMAAAAAIAVDLTVEYVDGFLDIRKGNEWVEIFVGDEISDEATIRLDEDSIAEIFAPGIKLTLTKPGVYEVAALINASGEQRATGLASMVGGKVASLFSDRKVESQAAVMGVRGAKSESEVQWMTGDTMELVKAGRESLEENSFEDALASFEEAYDFAEIEEETEVLFFLGYTSYLMGNVRDAANYLGEIMEVDTEAEFFPNLLLLNGQVLAETFAFEDAIEWLQTYRDAETVDESVLQTALLLEGVSFKALENYEQAKKAFEASKAIDPTSDVGQTVAKLIEDL